MASDSPSNPDTESSDLDKGSSRIANFFRMPVGERIAALHQRGLLNSDDVHQLVSANHQLQVNVADKMIENVVGVFGLPMGVALNFFKGPHSRSSKPYPISGADTHCKRL